MIKLIALNQSHRCGSSLINSSHHVCRANMDSAQNEKVRKYEEFVDRRLKPDLVHAIAERYSPVLRPSLFMLITLLLLDVFILILFMF